MKDWKRYLFLLCVSGVFCLSAGAQHPVERCQLERVKKYADCMPNGREAMDSLLLRADRALRYRVVPVTEKNSVAASGDPHDYVSMGPYWWPDPAKPDGLPYIRRDGERNPELNQLDRIKLDGLAGTVNTLAYAYYFTGNEQYARKAIADLQTWFLDKGTRMNPNLNYAQMIPGHDGGRGRAAGLIDTYCFVELTDCISLLAASPAMSAEVLNGLKNWFSEFTDWFLTSHSGVQEQNSTNNHSVAYDVQVAAFAYFAGRQTVVREIAGRFTRLRLQRQIAPDGSMPRELERTMALHYTLYNLDHILDMAVLAERVGVEILLSEEGADLFRRSIRFVASFLGRPQSEFPYRQINDWEGNQRKLAWTLLRSTRFIGNNEYVELFEKYNNTSSDNFNWLRFSGQYTTLK